MVTVYIFPRLITMSGQGFIYIYSSKYYIHPWSGIKPNCCVLYTYSYWRKRYEHICSESKEGWKSHIFCKNMSLRWFSATVTVTG
jgi:hypothetical protein